MSGTFGTVGFFVALIMVIVIHELAHFGVAKAFGIKVTEFFVGFGPRIWSTRRGETEYGVKWILAGGYVKIAGMNPYETVDAQDVPRTFGAKPIWQRALVIVAGPGTHFVLAFVLFAAWIGFVGRWDDRSPLVYRVHQTLDGVESPAAAAGIRAGDRIVAVEGTEDPTHLELVCTTRAHVGEPVTLTVLRGERLLDAELIPVLGEVPKVYWDDCPGLRPVQGQVGLIGVTLAEARERGGLGSAITGGATLVWDSLVDSVQNLGRIFGPDGIGRLFELLFTDAPREVTDPASLVGIGQAAGQTASGGNAGDLLFLIGFLNVLIGFLNLLPLPPFDGGHLAVLAIERVRGRAVDMRKVIPVAVTVAAFFIVLTVSFIYLDIVKPLPLGP